MPYATANINGGAEANADVNGDYVIPNPGTKNVTVESRIKGQFFVIENEAVANALLTELVTPPGPADFVHNEANLPQDEFFRAEVNAYYHANAVHDFVKGHAPSYPGLDDTMTIRVNIAGNPGGAGYNLVDKEILLQQSGLDEGEGIHYSNEAWSSVVYHEYGHHLVNLAYPLLGGGGYAETVGDVMSLLMLDNPRVAEGRILNECDSFTRDPRVMPECHLCIDLPMR